MMFVVRTWKDRTGGELHVERWSDGEILVRSVGEVPSVVLNNREKVEHVAFILGEDS